MWALSCDESSRRAEVLNRQTSLKTLSAFITHMSFWILTPWTLSGAPLAFTWTYKFGLILKHIAQFFEYVIHLKSVTTHGQIYYPNQSFRMKRQRKKNNLRQHNGNQRFTTSERERIWENFRVSHSLPVLFFPRHPFFYFHFTTICAVCFKLFALISRLCENTFVHPTSANRGFPLAFGKIQKLKNRQSCPSGTCAVIFARMRSDVCCRLELRTRDASLHCGGNLLSALHLYYMLEFFSSYFF